MTWVPESSPRIRVVEAAKRLGIVHIGVPGQDWFTTWSPKNENSNGEGTWEHMIALAIGILKDPLTEHVKPHVYRMMCGVEPMTRYSETERYLTSEELSARFADATEDDEVTFFHEWT